MCKFASSLLGNLCFEQKRMGGDAYIEKVSTMALCSLTSQIVSQTRSLSKSKATVDVHWVCITTARIVPIFQVLMRVVCIHVWASALLDLDRRAMRDAFEKWDEQQVQRPTLFYYMYRDNIVKNRLVKGWLRDTLNMRAYGYH